MNKPRPYFVAQRQLLSSDRLAAGPVLHAMVFFSLDMVRDPLFNLPPIVKGWNGG